MRANESLPAGWVIVYHGVHQDAWRIAPWWYGIPWKAAHWIAFSVWFPYVVKAWPDAYEGRLREAIDDAYTRGLREGCQRTKENYLRGTTPFPFDGYRWPRWNLPLAGERGPQPEEST